MYVSQQYTKPPPIPLVSPEASYHSWGLTDLPTFYCAHTKSGKDLIKSDFCATWLLFIVNNIFSFTSINRDDLCPFSHLGRGWRLPVWREEATPCISCTELQFLWKKNYEAFHCHLHWHHLIRDGSDWFDMVYEKWIEQHCCIFIYVLYVLTFKEAPASEDEEGDEVVWEVVHGGHHHTWSAWLLWFMVEMI